MSRITDKQRLDWLQRRIEPIRIERACAGLWKVFQFDNICWEDVRGETVRKSIDAAIRSERLRERVRELEAGK